MFRWGEIGVRVLIAPQVGSGNLQQQLRGLLWL
jgi:hypothetical protein